jgi:flagellar protein FliS
MILSASPLELTRLLYQRAIASVREAREHLAERRITERGKAINRAYLILIELSVSLRAEAAPELTARLSGLYGYMQKRLLDANLRQQDEPLAEVLGLLTTLAEAWSAIPDAAAAPAISANPWSSAMRDDTVRIAVSA